MPFPILAAAIIGGASVLSGILGNQAAAEQAEENRLMTAQENLKNRQFAALQASQQAQQEALKSGSQLKQNALANLMAGIKR